MSDITNINTFIFGSIKIDYELSFQDRKTLGIKVYPDCSVKVIAPFKTASQNILKKLKEKAPWIIRQQRDFLSYHPLTPPRKFINGETHLYLGRQYRLRIEKGPKNEVKLIRGRLFIYKKENANPKDILNDWYREKACLHFYQLLQNVLPKFKKHGINKPELQLRQMSNRWGSCTTKGKVILNPELIKAPKGSIEYVIIHELCHLVHHNHTKTFYELQENIMPDWEKWKDRLERLLV
ncbi:MAG: M48 family metallopeptidase [Candidatus Cyclobacteriaceae bacterium M2_1C_046]